MRVLHWFRKDLRLDDNTSLHHAAADSGGDVVPFYTSEPEVLGRPDLAPIRVQFVLDALRDLGAAVERAGSRLALAHGPAHETVLRAARDARADAVYWNDEYEPARVARDARVQRALEDAGLRVRRFPDRLLIAPGAVRTREGRPYTVYTPFRKACEAQGVPAPSPTTRRFAAHDLPARRVATLERLGFAAPPRQPRGGETAARERLETFVEGALRGYARRRDAPAADGTSRIAADLTFGTLSPRTVAARVRDATRAGHGDTTDAETFLAQLRWRDFFAHVLYFFPHCETGAFRRVYDHVAWTGDPAHAACWGRGATGFPLVDAAMRQLAGTGWMHNRARMIVASFLAKDLLLDWRLGERHFMRHLIDGDLASNNGGWQWAASTGTDAQPWFRVFNPVRQGETFDPDGAYVARWVPELARVPARWIHRPWEAPAAELARAGVRLGEDYPRPIVDHRVQRERALAMYRAAHTAAAGAPT